jgi:hypothetical protein
MPAHGWEFYDLINQKCKDANFFTSQAQYAVGGIFFDIFERADHNTQNGIIVGPLNFDQYTKDIADTKIIRDIADSQQDFDLAAATFKGDEIQRRIELAIENFIVQTVRANTAGWKPFSVNIAAGVIAGTFFAATTNRGYRYVKIDPSLNAVTRVVTGQHPAPSPTPTGTPLAPKPP